MKTACVQMTGPDVAMDLMGDSYYDFANPLPAKCPHCTFPDFDFIAKPYLLTKGFASPAETGLARVGNFFVRERAKQILELAVPEACTFHPTAERKSKQPTAWWLAVPNRKLETIVNKAEPPFCSKCGAPKRWAAVDGEIWTKMKLFDSGGADVFKQSEWQIYGVAEDDFTSTNDYRSKSGFPPMIWAREYRGIEPPSHPERWTRTIISRDLYFSVRLEQLLKRAKVKGQLVRLLNFKDVMPSSEDEAWIAEKLKLLAAHGLVDAPKPAAGKTTDATRKWFKQFLRKNAATKTKPADVAAVEKEHKLTLPADYKDFIASIGEKSFADVNDMEGSTTTVLAPAKLDFKDYRRGKVSFLEGEQAEVDGVMFASIDNGDCFVFDVSAQGSDYPVFCHNHEENTLEPYAPNFAACIKRFAQRN
jgi:hypothetical protein